eukprot:5002928-Pyramimonas_sp.AAC.1
MLPVLRVQNHRLEATQGAPPVNELQPFQQVPEVELLLQLPDPKHVVSSSWGAHGGAPAAGSATAD